MSSFSFSHRLQLTKEAIAKLPPDARAEFMASFRLVLWIMGPLLVVTPLGYLFTESARDMIACRGRVSQAVAITAEELQTMPVGSHVRISNCEIVVQSEITSSGIHAERDNVPLYSGSPASASDRRSVYVTLSQETAGAAAVLGMHSKFSLASPAEQISLPPLDAVIVERDEHTIRLVESAAAFTYTGIIVHRGIALICAAIGFLIIVWLVRRSAFVPAVTSGP
jgi:hypothetical protein